MDRLTIRNSDGSVSQPTDLKWAEALDCLAAYEDTGLTPEDCARATEIDDILLDEYYPIGRMRELIKADKEGRVIVLPAVRYCEQYGWQNITWDEKYGVCAGSWNTCEEAEKALEAMKK